MKKTFDLIPEIPGYHITEMLYSGTRTLVYRGIQESDRKPVVIKLLKNEFPNFNELVQFRNQYTLAKNLNLTSIIKPYNLAKYRNGYALVMEDFGGISLRDYFNKTAETNRFSLDIFLAIALQLADILDALYRQRIIHKDIKPANILINPNTKQVKLIDFSIASLLPRETQEIQNPNVLEGTLAYLSPEQTGRMNRGIDYRSDFYSLGVTFFEILTGKLPFDATDPIELVHCHIAKQPDELKIQNTLRERQRRTKFKNEEPIPQVLSDVVMKLMAKNAEDRYQSALGLKHDLEICLKHWQETKTIPHFKLGQRDISDRFIIPEKLYGRLAEVQALLDAFDRVAGINNAENSQPKSELILVTGFSGIGKTAVINEVHKPIVRQRGYFIKGKFDQFNRNIPFSAFVQAFRDLMEQLLSETDAQLEQWKTKILAALGENAQVIIEVIPELDRIIGKQPPVPELSGSAAQNRFNMLFQKFIQIFTTKEHPLAIFIDDLQWADSASLQLMQLLMSQPDSHYLLLIGAYRNNEVSLAHPLISTLEEIAKSKTRITTITLSPLPKLSVNQLVADTLSCAGELALPLTELVMGKTKGNPFFITQFLKALHQDKLITFNLENNYWECDLAKVRILALTDDIVEFMALQLQKLPIAAQNALKLAACIGNSFDLGILAIVSEKSATETAGDLWQALREGLILPISDVYKFYQQESLVNSHLSLVDEARSMTNDRGQITVTYKFLHDRVQQAAYSLIPPHQKQATHLKIGQLLLHNCSAIEREENLFDIVGHLNIGKELITEPRERETLTLLNFLAGGKARNATAYNAARIYLQTGIEFLTANCWKNQYELTLNLFLAAAEAAYLNGDFDGMEQMAEKVLQEAQTILDRVKIYEILILARTSQGKILEAIAVGRKALGQLGVEFPAEPNETSIAKALQTLMTQLKGRQIEQLVDLPVMTDAKAQAALQLLGRLFPPIFLGMPGLLPFLSATMVSLSLQFGNAPGSSVGYAIHGLVLCTFLEEVETGYGFGKLALNLMERFNVRELKPIILAFFGSFIQHRQETLLATLSTLKGSYTASMETGDLLQAGYSIISYFHHNLLSGRELSIWEPEIPAYHAVMVREKQFYAQIYLSILWQTVCNLRETTSQPDCLVGSTYDETVMLPKHLQDNDFTAIAIIYIYKLLLAYTFDNYLAALDYIDRVKPYLMAVSGMVFVPIFHFYAALTHLAMFSIQSETERSEILELVENHQTVLHRWAQKAPMNHLHKWYLVEAEKYRVLGEKLAAMECYDRAISLAEEHQFIHEEALANELAAKFYLDWGKDKIAPGYMQEAYYCYARWGAKAKVTDLEQRYPKLLVPILQQMRSQIASCETITITGTIGSSHFNTSSNVSTVLDLTTILKASQTLSGEIELKKLLCTLLHIAIENAGADKCALLLLKEGKLLIEAMMRLGEEPILLRSLSLEDTQEVPISLINTVKRTLQPKAIANVTEHPLLLADPYIITQQPKSLLCMPILRQGKLLGVLYLENSLATGAFTSDRVEVLHILCAQAAISLENAQLYQQSQTYANQLEQSLEKLQLSEARFQKLTDNVPGMIYQLRLTADGSVSIPYVSSGCYDLYEVTAEEILTENCTLRGMEHPDDRADITRSMQESAQNLTAFRREWRIITKSGKIKWIQAISQPEWQADGSIVWDGVVVDISDRKAAEVSLAKEREFLNAIIHNITDGIVVCDGNGTLTLFNNATREFHGLPVEPLPPEQWAEYFDLYQSDGKTPLPITEIPLFRALQGEIVQNIEMVIAPKYGLRRILLASGQAIFDDEGNKLGAVVAMRDITDRKAAEAKRQQAENAMRQSEERYRSLTAATSQIIWITDGEGRNSDMPLWSAYTGQSAEEINNWGWLQAIHPDDRDRTNQIWNRAVETKSWYETEYRLRGADGCYRYVVARAVPILGEDGSIREWIGTCTDIDDRKRAEAQLQQKATELENTLLELQQAQIHLVQSEKMSALGNLVSGIAHEINNPLGFLSGNIQPALDYIKDVFELVDLYQSKYPSCDLEIQDKIEEIELDYLREDLPKLVGSMQEGVNRIREISTSLRIFSRADRDYKVPFNVHDGIDSTILILKHRLKGKDRHPEIEVLKEYGNLPPIQCFPGQLNQVFMNILANAVDALEEANQGRSFAEIKASPNRITIRTETIDNQWVKIRIADNGIGMTPEVKQQIFDHLFTTKAVGKGTGLGLAIAKSIVLEKHGGAIEVNSVPGEGTEFAILLPINK